MLIPSYDKIFVTKTFGSYVSKVKSLNFIYIIFFRITNFFNKFNVAYMKIQYSIVYSHLIVINPLMKWWEIRMLELKVWCILRSIDEIPSRLSCGCLLRSSKYLGWGRDGRWTVNHKIIILAFSFNEIAILAFNFNTVTKPVFDLIEFMTLAFSIHFNKITNHSIQTLE